MHLDNWLSQRAETCPDRCALIADGTQLTYAELEREATATARRLAAAGRSPRGDRRAHPASRGSTTSSLLHALMKLGAIAHPVNTRLGPAELAAELARVSPRSRSARAPTSG